MRCVGWKTTRVHQSPDLTPPRKILGITETIQTNLLELERLLLETCRMPNSIHIPISPDTYTPNANTLYAYRPIRPPVTNSERIDGTRDHHR